MRPRAGCARQSLPAVTHAGEGVVLSGSRGTKGMHKREVPSKAMACARASAFPDAARKVRSSKYRCQGGLPTPGETVASGRAAGAST